MLPASAVKSYEDTLLEILREYDLKPRKWRISLGRSRDNRFFDMIISQDSLIWQIKFDTLYRPAPFGIGAKIDSDDLEQQIEVPFYGFRPISKKQLIEIQSGEELNQILNEIMKTEPVPTSRISGEPGFVQGPVAIQGDPLFMEPLNYISEKQKDLDRMLTHELNSILFKRYSGMDYI